MLLCCHPEQSEGSQFSACTEKHFSKIYQNPYLVFLMPSLTDLKQQLYQQLHILVAEKADAAKNTIASAKEARDSETKSSVGDKYETGRAMMQAEMSRQEVQLQKALQMKAELSRLNMDKTYTTATLGSLVLTDRGTYFLSIGLGRLPGSDNHYAISPASPIGQLLLGKKVGDRLVLEGREYVLLDIA